MKTLFLLFLLLSLSLSKQNVNLSNKTLSIDTTLLMLKKKRAEMDAYAHKHYKDLIVLVKLEGKKNLVRLKKDFPETTEYIYNIVKDSNGKIIIIYEGPYSQSGDWYVEIKHYFNNDGKTFAFSERETVFDDSVNDGLAEQGTYKYYNDSFKQIAQSYQLIDLKRRPIKRNKNEFDFQNEKYKIYSNLNECLKAYNIKL